MGKTIICLTACFIAGCASAPVGWGGTHQIVSANPAAVTIKYDALVGGMDEAMNEAQGHCTKFNKNAVPTTSRYESLLTVQVFECR